MSLARLELPNSYGPYQENPKKLFGNDNHEDRGKIDIIYTALLGTIMPPQESTGATDARIEASEARSETKLARLEGKFDTQSAITNAKLDSLVAVSAGTTKAIQDQTTEARSNKFQILGALVAAVLAIAGLVIGLLSYREAAFYNGTVMRDAVKSAVQEVEASRQSAPAETQAPKVI